MIRTGLKFFEERHVRKMEMNSKVLNRKKKEKKKRCQRILADFLSPESSRHWCNDHQALEIERFYTNWRIYPFDFFLLRNILFSVGLAHYSNPPHLRPQGPFPTVSNSSFFVASNIFQCDSIIREFLPTKSN